MNNSKHLNFRFVVGEENLGIRIDKYLAQEFAKIKPEITRSQIQHLSGNNLITNSQGKPIENLAHKTELNQIIIVNYQEKEVENLIATDVKFAVVYQDEDLMVINKPHGLTVHPGIGNSSNTLVNGLIFNFQNQLSDISGEFRPGIVHRLDKDTSGLMLVAKNNFTHLALSQDLEQRTIDRRYLAFVYGSITPAVGKIDTHITRDHSNRLRMIASKTIGKRAVTNYKTIKIFANNFASLIECKLDTGRTHQIRTHLEFLKHSIIGDQSYNRCKKNLHQDQLTTQEGRNLEEWLKTFTRQALHSYKISFIHPRSKEEMSFEVDLPQDLQELESLLKSLQ